MYHNRTCKGLEGAFSSVWHLGPEIVSFSNKELSQINMLLLIPTSLDNMWIYMHRALTYLLIIDSYYTVLSRPFRQYIGLVLNVIVYVQNTNLPLEN